MAKYTKICYFWDSTCCFAWDRSNILLFPYRGKPRRSCCCQMESDPCSSRPGLYTNHRSNHPTDQPTPLPACAKYAKRTNKFHPPIPLFLWSQNSNWFIEYVAIVNDYWGSNFLQVEPEAWVSISAIYKDGRHDETKTRVRRTVYVNHRFIIVLQSSLLFVLSSHISCGFPPKNAFPGHHVRPVQVHRWPTTLFSALLPLTLYCWKGTENESESNFVLIWRASCVLCASPQGPTTLLSGDPIAMHYNDIKSESRWIRE